LPSLVWLVSCILVWIDPATARGAVDEPWRECGVRASRWPSDGVSGVHRSSCDELGGGQGPLCTRIISCNPWIECFSVSEFNSARSCRLANGYRQPYRLLLVFACVLESLSASNFFVYELLRALQLGDYPQGSAGRCMKAYSSASHSTVIVLIGLESVVNTKHKRGSFRLGISPCLLPLLKTARYLL
jgi:hypothetical protein